MKQETKLLKDLGQLIFGSKGKTKTQTCIEKRKYLNFETDKKQRLSLELNRIHRTIDIFKEFDPFDKPSYQIPERFMIGVTEGYVLGKCPTCGNVAITSTHGEHSFTVCIEPPNFHSFHVDKGKAVE